MGFFESEEAPFTSTLGVGEFALLSQLTARPLGQVMGVCVHKVGWQWLPGAAQWGGDVVSSLDNVSNAWEDARRQAFDRMTEEASALGADAVVGVRLRRSEHDWARGAVDYVVTGTAIRTDSDAPTGGPVLSDLSGDDYWKLLAAGWAPAGLLATTAVFFIAQSARVRWRRWLATARNQELGEFSRGFSLARTAALDRLRRQAQAARADGIVGVDLRYEIARDRVRVKFDPAQRRTGLSEGAIAIGAHVPIEGQSSRSGIVITFQAVGTAIRRVAVVERARTPTVIRLDQ